MVSISHGQDTILDGSESVNKRIDSLVVDKRSRQQTSSEGRLLEHRLSQAIAVRALRVIQAQPDGRQQRRVLG